MKQPCTPSTGACRQIRCTVIVLLQRKAVHISIFFFFFTGGVLFALAVSLPFLRAAPAGRHVWLNAILFSSVLFLFLSKGKMVKSSLRKDQKWITMRIKNNQQAPDVDTVHACSLVVCCSVNSGYCEQISGQLTVPLERP